MQHRDTVVVAPDFIAEKMIDNNCSEICVSVAGCCENKRAPLASRATVAEHDGDEGPGCAPERLAGRLPMRLNTVVLGILRGEAELRS